MESQVQTTSTHPALYFLSSPEIPSSLSIASVNDLIPAVYEGGFKLWECTQDLLEYLIHSLNSEFNSKSQTFLDLGCGHGLVGIYLAKNNQ